MPSLHKDPRGKSPYWYCSFTLPSGRRTLRSTKQRFKDRAAAAKICQTWEDLSRKGSRGRLTESVARKVIQDIYEDANQEALPGDSVEKYFQTWLGVKLGEVSEATARKYQDVTNQFIEYLGDRKTLEISRIGKAEFAGFRDSIGKRLSPSTANLALKIIRSAFTQAKRDGCLTENPALLVQGLKDSNKESDRRAFTLPELKNILNASNDEWRGMILFGLYTGQRLGDVATLTWQNIDLEREEVRLTTGKTGRRQIIPLAKPLLNFIESLPASDNPKQPLFSESFASVERTGKVATLSNQFYGILEGAGMVKERSHKKRGAGRSVTRETGALSFHCLRHTATSLLKNAGISPAIVQEFVGHDSKTVSENYTHIETSAMRAAADSMPDLTEGLSAKAK